MKSSNSENTKKNNNNKSNHNNSNLHNDNQTAMVTRRMKRKATSATIPITTASNYPT